MEDITSMIREDGTSCIITCNGTVVEISHSFANMTDYLVEDFLEKDIKEVFKMLRIGPNINSEKIDGEAEYFLFNKSLEVRFVNIQVIEEAHKQLYVFKEKPNSRLSIKFHFADKLCADNYYGIAIFSLPDVTLLKANETFASFFDEPYNRKENCIGKRVDEFVTGFKGSTSEQIWKTILATGETYNIDEYMYDRLERGITYWRSSLIPIFENGELKYCVEMTTDITNEVLNRKKLEEQNKQLEAIISNMSDSLMVFDKNGNFIINNSASKTNLNTSSYKNVGDSYKPGLYLNLEGREVPLSDIPSMKILNGETVKDQIMHVKFPTTDRYIKVNGTPLFDNNGEFYMGIVCIHDITDIVEKEKEIKKQKELLESIMENTYENLFVIDINGEYLISRNNIVKQISSKLKNFEELYRSLKCYDLDGNEIPIDRMPPYRVLRRETVLNEIIHLKGDGVEFEYYVIVNGVPVYDEKGNFLYGVITSRNITEFVQSQYALKETQEKLLLAECEKNEALEKALEMKDEFLSIISHEFRTPLNVINAVIQAMNLICKDELTDRTKEYIKMIKQNVFRQMRLVNNLLDITRANSGHIKINKKNLDIVYLTKSIIESVNTYAADKGVAVTFVSSVNKKMIGIDDEKYERILLNLVSNAIKFSIKDKIVTVKLRSVKNKICIEVIDKGIGIPENKIDVIFEKFGQVDSSLSRYAEGAGIGLSLVKKLVDALGGSISVKSIEGKGSTFTVMLPSEKIIEDCTNRPMVELLDNRLIEVTNVEFSDIYL